jgi:hypothetical protein
MLMPPDYDLLKRIAERARGTKRCQLCGASYTKHQNHDEDCPVGMWIKSSAFPELRKAAIRPEVLDFEALVSNGLRIRYEGPDKCWIEAKDGDNWRPLKYVRNVNISVGVDHEPPMVKMEYYLFNMFEVEK